MIIFFINYINYMYLIKYKRLFLFIVFNILCSLLVKYCVDHIDDGCREKKLLCFIRQNSTNITVISYTIENSCECHYNGHYNPLYPYLPCYNYSDSFEQSKYECPRLNCTNEIYAGIIFTLACMYIIQIVIIGDIMSRVYKFMKN